MTMTVPDKEIILKFIGELSLNNFMLSREVELKDVEISKLRQVVEKLSNEQSGPNRG